MIVVISAFLFPMLFVCCLIACMGTQKHFPRTLEEIKYELLFLHIGMWSIIDDVLKRNRMPKIALTTVESSVAVLTGANRGIGLEILKRLLSANYTVYIGVRNVAQAEKLVDGIRDSGVTTGNCQILHLDIASLASVREFAMDVKKSTDQINILINNAGVMFEPFHKTEDGFEYHYGVNYLGHFYLTHLLFIGLIKGGIPNSKNSRIINVSSCAHEAGTMKKDFNIEKVDYIPAAAYAQSKLAQLMFTTCLNQLIEKKGIAMQVHAVHPGVVHTELFKNTALNKYTAWIPAVIFKTPKEGTLPILYAALSKSIEGRGGSYISNCRETSISKTTQYNDKSRELFYKTCDLLGIDSFGGQFTLEILKS